MSLCHRRFGHSIAIKDLYHILMLNNGPGGIYGKHSSMRIKVCAIGYIKTIS